MKISRAFPLRFCLPAAVLGAVVYWIMLAIFLGDIPETGLESNFTARYWLHTVKTLTAVTLHAAEAQTIMISGLATPESGSLFVMSQKLPAQEAIHDAQDSFPKITQGIAGQLIISSVGTSSSSWKLPTPRLFTPSTDDVIDAIIEVEGVRDPYVPGKNGELGFTRITPGVWGQHTRAPFSRCGWDAQWERGVAKRHILWLERQFLKRDIRPTPYMLALAWNGGFAAWLKADKTGTVNPAVRDYATRVSNIVLNHP